MRMKRATSILFWDRILDFWIYLIIAVFSRIKHLPVGPDGIIKLQSVHFSILCCLFFYSYITKNVLFRHCSVLLVIIFSSEMPKSFFHMIPPTFRVLLLSRLVCLAGSTVCRTQNEIQYGFGDELTFFCEAQGKGREGQRVNLQCHFYNATKGQGL